MLVCSDFAGEHLCGVRGQRAMARTSIMLVPENPANKLMTFSSTAHAAESTALAFFSHHCPRLTSALTFSTGVYRRYRSPEGKSVHSSARTHYSLSSPSDQDSYKSMLALRSASFFLANSMASSPTTK